MNEQVPGIASILDDLGIDACNISVLAIGLSKAEVPEIEGAHAYEALSGPEDLPETLRVQLGIVVLPLASMPQRTRSSSCLACGTSIAKRSCCSTWAPHGLRTTCGRSVTRK